MANLILVALLVVGYALSNMPPMCAWGVTVIRILETCALPKPSSKPSHWALAWHHLSGNHKM